MDEEGFVAVGTDNKSQEQLWNFWLRPPAPPKAATLLPVPTEAFAAGGGRFHVLAEDDEEEATQEQVAVALARGDGEITLDAPSQPVVPRRAEEVLRRAVDAWSLSYEERVAVYDYLQGEARREAQAQMEALAHRYAPLHQQYKNVRVSEWARSTWWLSDEGRVKDV
jgi:hypothetical protein